MRTAPLPPNEEQRLADLRSYNILDSEEEQDYNQLVELASLICGTPISVINFIDLTRQWGKAKYGLGDTEAPREISMCAHTILENDVLQVEDTLLDSRFFDNPFTTDGGIRFYAGAPIRSENGYNIGSICVCDTKPKKLDERQVTALKKLSRQAAVLLEVRKQNRELQQFALAERGLKEKAEAARKAQEAFLSTMSHEIRTPLNGMIGMVNLLQAECPKPEQKEYIDSLQFAGKNLLYLVNDILDFNKIAAGKLALEEVEFNLPKLFDDVRKLHLLKASEKGIALTVDADPALPTMVIADPNRLTQVLNNLIGNAVKFTLNGGVTLRTRVTKKEGDNVTVLVEIQDTGIGFDEKQAAILFEEFTQADKSISRQFGGTGLGLSISKKLLALMGSAIRVKSVPGHGSCFSFELPLKAVPCAEQEKAKADAGKNTLSGLRILVADDNAINLMITRKVLQKAGGDVDVVYNGKEALDRLQTGAYNLVLMDVQMPVMDGITTIKKMRAEKLFTGPVILLTADAFINNNNEVQSWGFDDYLLKPFGAEELYRKVKKLVNPAFA